MVAPLIIHDSSYIQKSSKEDDGKTLFKPKKKNKEEKMRRIMFLVLMLNVFFLSGESLSELPIDKWPRDRRIDKQVKRLAKKIEFHCKLVKGDYGAFGWDIVGVKLLYKLGDLLEKYPEKVIPSLYDIAMDRGRDRLLRNFMWEGLIINAKEKACIRAAGEFINNKTEDEYLRANVAELLGKAKDTSATPYLIQVMEDKSNPERVRWCAAHAFVFIPDERAVKPLLKNLDEDPSMEVKKISISALGAIGRKTGNKDMVPKLMGIVEDKERNPLRYFAISALGAMKEDRLVPLLTQSIKNKDKRDFDVVIWALGNIGTPECKEALLQLLKDEDESIRFFAAKAIIKTGDKEAISEVERSLERFSSGHREVIGKALKEAKKE